MIVGHIDQRETFSYLPAAVHRSLAFLSGTNLETLPVGRHDIDGDKIFVNVMRLKLQARKVNCMKCIVITSISNS